MELDEIHSLYDVLVRNPMVSNIYALGRSQRRSTFNPWQQS